MKTRSVGFGVLSCLWFTLATPLFAQSYSFTTLAGSASQGTNDGPAAGARFFAPQGVCADPQGNLYVADSDNSTIREITPGGQVTTIAGQAGVYGFGNGPGTNALFYLPKSVAADAAGNLYVVDTFNQLIRKLTPTGTNWMVSTLAGQLGPGGYAEGAGTNAAFNRPSGAAVDAAGNIYVTDQGNDLIRKITPLGVVSTIAGQLGSSFSIDGTNLNAQFASPNGIAVDSATNLYVTDGDTTIRWMAPLGTNWVVTTIAGEPNNFGHNDGLGTNALFSGPAGVAVDTNANLYVADEYNAAVRKLTPTGTNWLVTTVAGLPGTQGYADGTNAAARFNAPSGLGIDPAGDLLIADVNNNNLRKITLAAGQAVVTTLAGIGPGGANGPGPTARFWNTTGVAVDTSRNVFVADYFNCAIRRIASNGVVTTVAGLPGTIGSSDGTNSDARFYDPIGLALDPQGNLYVTDIFNNTIRKITPLGSNWVVTTIAGNASLPPAEADGTNANARFYNPTGIAVDANTNLYVTDSPAQTIRKISPVGTNWVVSTIAGFPFASGSSNGLGTNASFLYPHGLAVDPATNVYVADSENDTIRKLSPAGANWLVTTIAGQAQVGGSMDGTGTNALFYFPEGIALDNSGNLFIADTFNDTLRRLTPVGTNWTSATLAGQVQVAGYADGLATNALFYMPEGIAVDQNGNLYVADTSNNTIRFGQIASGPTLQITLADGQVVLSWLNTGSFLLQTNANLSAPGWAADASPVTAADGTNTVTITPPPGRLFFRLASP